MEQSIQQLQLNLAASHQRHKSDTNQLQDQLSSLEAELRQAQALVQALQTELMRREDQIKQNEAEISALRKDIASKVDEVGFVFLLVYRIVYRKQKTFLCFKQCSDCLCFLLDMFGPIKYKMRRHF